MASNRNQQGCNAEFHLALSSLCPTFPVSAGNLQNIEETTGQLLGFPRSTTKNSKSLEISNITIKMYDVYIIYICVCVCVKFLFLDTEQQLSASGNTGFVSPSTVYLFSRRLEEMHHCNNSISIFRFFSAAVCLTHSFTSRSSLYCFS